MLVNAVTYTFPEGKADEVERLLRELGDASRRETGCANGIRPLASSRQAVKGTLVE
jgi:hypothetical protein